MKARRILALIGLIAVLVGFCLPWLDFYGHLSGKDIVVMCWPSGPGFSLLNILSVFIFLPFSALVTFALIVKRQYTGLLIASILLMDALIALGLWGISNVDGWHSMMYGYPILMLGVVLLHIVTIIPAGGYRIIRSYYTSVSLL